MLEINRILEEIESYAKLKYLPIIGPEKAKIITSVLDNLKPIRALEVGTLIGYSSLVIASKLPEHGSLTTIEKNPDFAKVAQNYFQKTSLKNKIELIVGDAIVEIPKLQGKYNFLFLDAEKSEYINYLKLSEPLLFKGSVVIADNVRVFENVLRDYLEYVRKSGDYQSQTTNVADDAMEVSLKIY